MTTIGSGGRRWQHERDRGTVPVIPTPFQDGVFDQCSMRRFLNFFLPWLDGYTLLGSTGEAPCSLSTAERMNIAESPWRRPRATRRLSRDIRTRAFRHHPRRPELGQRVSCVRRHTTC